MRAEQTTRMYISLNRLFERMHNQNHVQELVEANVEVVLGTEVQELLSNHSWLSSCAETISHQVVLEEVPPDAVRELGKVKAEGEQEQQPEVVGRHWRVLLALDQFTVFRLQCRQQSLISLPRCSLFSPPPGTGRII